MSEDAQDREQVLDGSSCGVGIRHEEQIRGLVDNVVELKEVNKEQWDAIEKLKNRPPVWVTFVISVMTGIIGFLTAMLMFYARMQSSG